MDSENYFKSLTKEIKALQNRVRFFIKNKNWLTDGEWKESVVRSFLKRNLPSNIKVGRGFIITPEKNSTQIDVLIYRDDKPIIYKDGELVFLTPDAVCGVIEVKTKLSTSELFLAIDKILHISEIVDKYTGRQPFTGIFSYESGSLNAEKIVKYLLNKSPQFHSPTINIISIGNNFFVKYWEEYQENERCLWRAYKLPGTAPAYFFHNAIEYICPYCLFFTGKTIWYPKGGKEDYRIAQASRFDNS